MVKASCIPVLDELRISCSCKKSLKSPGAAGQAALDIYIFIYFSMLSGFSTSMLPHDHRVA